MEKTLKERFGFQPIIEARDSLLIWTVIVEGSTVSRLILLGN